MWYDPSSQSEMYGKGKMLVHEDSAEYNKEGHPNMIGKDG